MNSTPTWSGASRRFLQANAKEEIIAYELSNLIRSFMRGFTSDDSSSAVAAAERQLRLVVDLFDHASDPIHSYRLCEQVVRCLKQPLQQGFDDDEDTTLEVARLGTKYLVESSAGDPAAAGRAAIQRDRFLEAVRHLKA